MTYAAIIAGIRDGDEVAAAALYDVFDPRMRNALARKSRQLTDDEGNVHDAYLLVLKAIERGDLRLPQFLRSYCWQVLFNVTATRFRLKASKTEHRPVDGLVLPESAPTPEAIYARKEMLERLDRMVVQLPRRSAAIVQLRREGLHHREIGARLGISEHESRLGYHRAVHRLKRLAA